MDQVYLSSDVQVEPLVDQWYAWPHLIPPATAARNLTERHIRLMHSYIEAPQIHASAVKNPKMLGGPFIDYGGQRVADIRQLLERTRNDRASLICLSKALQDLDGMLRMEAKGESLQRLYPLVPALLQGYVELTYDLNNQAGFRLIEPLLYTSEYYRKDAQSMMLSRTIGDDRPFVLSTPRLESEGLLHLKLPFDHESIDSLFKTKRYPRPFQELVERCQVRAEDQGLFRSFFTTKEPRPYEAYGGAGVRWRYFGHACILLETSKLRFLFDPVLSYTYETAVSRYTYDDLPDSIDFVVITHNHQDHILFETMLQLRHKIRCVVVPRNGRGHLQDPSLKLILENIGFKQVVEFDEMQTLEFDGGTLTGMPFLGEHADLNIQTKLAYLVQLGNHKLIFAADSCNVEPALYKHLHRIVGDVQTLFIGMECDGAPLSWLYGPLLTSRLERAHDVSRRLSGCNFPQAFEIVKVFNCRQLFVYAMGQEPWLKYIMSVKYTAESNPIVQSTRLLEACKDRNILGERLFGEREMLLAES